MWFVSYTRKKQINEHFNTITEEFPLDWLMNNSECCIIFYKRLPDDNPELVDKWRKELNK
jgi:hypothetical protein